MSRSNAPKALVKTLLITVIATLVLGFFMDGAFYFPLFFTPLVFVIILKRLNKSQVEPKNHRD